MSIPHFSTPTRPGAAVLAAALIATAAGAAEAQRPVPGFNRSDQTDVAGVIVTSGDQIAPVFAEPGTVRSMSCPVAWGVRTTASRAQAQLASADLTGILTPAGGRLDAAAQDRVLAVLTADARSGNGSDALLAALAPPHNRQATAAARKLVRESRGLFNVVQSIDPASPGPAGATRLSRTVGAYNGFIEASSAEFIASPPPELSALHSVLNALVIASLEHEGRAEDFSVVDAEGLACAIPFVPAVTAPPPPIEHAMEICVVVDGNVQYVAALWRPETGDTLALVAGERRPFGEVYPEPQRPAWVTVGDPIQVGTTEYRAFGVARMVRPGELTRAGEVGGAEYWVEATDRPPHAIIYFLASTDCQFQPYRSVETIRVRG
jgi:hypothetical protein